jgi:hypothetical protein
VQLKTCREAEEDEGQRKGQCSSSICGTAERTHLPQLTIVQGLLGSLFFVSPKRQIKKLFKVCATRKYQHL